MKNRWIIVIGLIVSMTLYGCAQVEEKDEVEIGPFPERKIELTTLYFRVMGERSLEKVTRVTERTFESAEEIIVKELINGPEDTYLVETIPSGTKLQGVTTIGSTVYVNLSQEFSWNFDDELHDESITIYSIVNSLTELSKIDEVQILIDGKVQNQYQQYVSLLQAFERNTKVMGAGLSQPYGVLQRYFGVIDEQDYRRAYDELYIPISKNIDYLNFFRHMLLSKGHVKRHKITKYTAHYLENEVLLEVDYYEEHNNGEVTKYIGQPFYFRDYFGEWKLVIDEV